MTLAVTLFFVLGLMLGSFLNLAMPRLHSGKVGICIGRSECPYCETPLRARDLVPLLSYVLLRGHCRTCKKSIHWHYPVFEFVTALAFVLILSKTYTPTPTPDTIAITTLLLLYTLVLIAVSLYDMLYGEIPDRVMLPALALALLAIPLPFTPSAADAIIGALIPLGFFGLLILISHGRWMGGGDLRLGAFMGLILGWQLTLVGLGFAYVSGSIISLILIGTKRKKRTDIIPFGPFLAGGTLFAILWGEYALQWYLTLIGTR